MLTSSSVTIPEGELRFEQDADEIFWENGPIESWRHTDHHGHLHTYTEEASPGQVWRKGKRRKDRDTHYPTLRYVIDARYRCYSCDPADPHWVDSWHWECLECGEQVAPAFGPGSKLIPTLRAWYLDGQPITKEQAEALLRREQAAEVARQQAAVEARVLRGLGYPPGFGDQR
jgi:hypothetical protein